MSRTYALFPKPRMTMTWTQLLRLSSICAAASAVGSSIFIASRPPEKLDHPSLVVRLLVVRPQRKTRFQKQLSLAMWSKLSRREARSNATSNSILRFVQLCIVPWKCRRTRSMRTAHCSLQMKFRGSIGCTAGTALSNNQLSTCAASSRFMLPLAVINRRIALRFEENPAPEARTELARPEGLGRHKRS